METIKIKDGERFTKEHKKIILDRFLKTAEIEVRVGITIDPNIDFFYPLQEEEKYKDIEDDNHNDYMDLIDIAFSKFVEQYPNKLKLIKEFDPYLGIEHYAETKVYVVKEKK